MLLVLARDAYEWLTFAATSVAAIGTALAVIVALFGPGWRARRRAPSLRLEVVDVRSSAFLNTSSGYFEEITNGPTLRIQNAPGKDAARGVEVAVTLERREDPKAAGQILAEDLRLNFIDPLTGTSGVASADIPAGSSRRVYFVLLGRQEAIARRLAPPHDNANTGAIGALATCPARADMTVWLTSGDYFAQLVLAGSNLDATLQRMRFSLTYHPPENREPAFHADPEAPGKPDCVELVFTEHEDVF